VLAKRETTRRGTLDNRLGVSIQKPRRITRNDQSVRTFLRPIGLAPIQEPDFPSVSSSPITAQAVPQ
jgi:hypothetical protein